MCKYRETALAKKKMQILVLYKGFQNKFTEIVPDVKLFTVLFTETSLQQRETMWYRRINVFNLIKPEV